ncbi:MAG: LysR family transcriptional regulator [Lachnospiraceae bacterium]|nr:LysR family transcriptional regulator [Lachnospiraceae bacterium]
MVDDKIYSMVKVYELGSFVAAAKALNLTQPAVSQHIKAIEQEFGVTIFDRQHGKVQVTIQGEKILRTALKMIGMENQIVAELKENTSGPEHLTIGITHTSESNPIVEALASYSASHGDVALKIITESVPKLYRALEQYELDFAVVDGRIGNPELEYITLSADTLLLMVPSAHPLAGERSVTLERLKQERLILRLPESGTQELFTAHLKSHNESISDFHVILETDNVSTIRRLVKLNYGCSILPKSACMNSIRDGSITALSIEGLEMKREILMAYQRDFRYPDALQFIAKKYRQLLETY